jgi:hypothetical protein
MKAMHPVFLGALLAVSVACGPAVVTTEVRVGPPPIRIETPSKPPGPGAYWVAGHWQWNGREYVWFGGHWAVPKPSEVWVQAFWTEDAAGWHYHPGRWVRVAPPASAVRVVVQNPPPPPRVEVVREAPSHDHFWVSGHWRRDGHDWDWVAGRWERRRPAEIWVAPHWIKSGPEWVFVGGYWQKD